MSEHERIRELLPLAASGDISPEEMRQVREHLSRCDTCAHVSEDFVALGSALRGLPTPLPRAELVTRVQELAELRLGRKRAWSRDAVVLAPLVAAGWIMALATWPLVRTAGVWLFTGWHVPGAGFGTALAFYSILGFLLACVSAFAVGRRARHGEDMMSSFWARLRLIPRPALITGCLLPVLLVLPIALGPMRSDLEMRSWPMLAKVGLVAIIPTFIFLYAALVGFIYADAKRRRMRHVMWAWLALVPYFVGVILYFILRDPLPTPCHRCGMEVPQAFAFCPGCGASIHPICSQCGRSLQPEWSNCPHCGTRLIAPGAASSSWRG